MHPLPGVAPEWTQGYQALDFSEQRVMRLALNELGDFAELWYRLLNLYVEGILGVSIVQEEEAQLPWEIRSQLIGLALGNSKAALDMGLAGYYSACYGLIRHLMETWEQVAYIRLKPESAIAWKWQEDESPRSQFEPGTTRRRKRLKADHEIKDALPIAKSLTKKLDKGAHPTLEGLLQTTGEGIGRHVIGATFKHPMALLALDAGIWANSLLLKELDHLRPQSNEWRQQVADIEERRRELHRVHPPI